MLQPIINKLLYCGKPATETCHVQHCYSFTNLEQYRHVAAYLFGEISDGFVACTILVET